MFDKDKVAFEIQTQFLDQLGMSIDPYDTSSAQLKYPPLAQIITGNFCISYSMAERIVGFGRGHYFHNAIHAIQPRNAIFYEAFFINLALDTKEKLDAIQPPDHTVQDPEAWIKQFFDITKISKRHFISHVTYDIGDKHFWELHNAIYRANRHAKLVTCYHMYEMYKNSVTKGLDMLRDGLVLGAKYF